MSTILLTWELGGGLGHLVRLQPIGKALVQRGYRVVAAMRNVPDAQKVFADSGVDIVQAPKGWFKTPPFSEVRSIAHMLGNCGFASQRALVGLMDRWEAIFQAVKPSLVVADHSPSALLALRGLEIPCVTMGLGFYCPPATHPLPIWLGPDDQAQMLQFVEDEKRVTAVANEALRARGKPPLEWLGQLYADVRETFLTTYPEFDPVGERPGARYWGHWGLEKGIAPQWPKGKGPKIYGYLKPVPILEELLRLLNDRGWPTIIFHGGFPQDLVDKHQSSTLHFEYRPLDIVQAAAECDAAILHGGHGATASMLLAGKPCLLIPIFFEQVLFSQRIEQLGMGRIVDRNSAEFLAKALVEIASIRSRRDAAEQFSRKYRNWNVQSLIAEIVDRIIKSLVNLPPRCQSGPQGHSPCGVNVTGSSANRTRTP